MSEKFHRPTLLIYLSFVFVVGLADQSLARQDDFEIGDKVEVQFMGKSTPGEVVGFFGPGWPKVKIEHDGQTMEMPLPPSEVSKIKEMKNDGAGGAAESADSGLAPSESAERTWTDASGKFSVDAKLISETVGQIELQKSDGRVVTLPLEKLCDADKKFVAQWKLSESDANPFSGGTMKHSSSGEETTSTLTSDRSPKISPEFSGEFVLSASQWNVTPDAAQPAESSRRVIKAPESLMEKPFHNRVSDFVISSNHQFASATATNAFEKFSELVRIDLTKRETSNNLKINIKDCNILAISPTGNVVATIKESRGSEPGQLDVWKFENDNLKHKTSWKTAGFHDRDGFSPKSGILLEDNRLMTIGRQVALWDIEKAKSIYAFKITGSHAFSANQKQFAVVSGKSVWIINTSDGDVLGNIEIDEPVVALAFSDSGNFLAGCDARSGAIYVWDLEIGNEFQQLATTGSAARSIDWVGDEYLLLNDQDLINIKLRSSVWKYQIDGRGSLVNSNDGRFWLASDSQLTPIELPHKDMSSLHCDLDPDDLLILKPGSEIALDLELPFDASESEEIRNRFSDQLEALGLTINPSADLKLSASVEKQKQEKSEMSSFFDPFGHRGSVKIKYTPTTSAVKITRGDDLVWRKTAMNTVHGVLHLNEKEKPQQAANRVCKPKPEFFSSIKLPPKMAALPAEIPVQSSKITSAGIE